MISTSRDRVAVALDFEVGERTYRIARTLRRNGSQMVRLEEDDGGGTFRGLADQVRAVGDQVVTILGLAAPAFMQAVILPQGEFARFLKAQPRDRRSMLRTLLRLDVYERMRERAQASAAARKSSVEALQRLLAEEYADVDEAAVVHLETAHARVVESLEASRKKRDDAQGSLARLRTQHARTYELRQVEERRAVLEKIAESVSRAKAILEASARAVPLVPRLEEAARAAAAAKAATQAAAEAEGRQGAAEKDWQQRSATLKSAETAAAAIPTMREQVARLNQVLGRLPERQQLQTAIERQGRGLRALDDELSTLAAAIQSAEAAQGQQQASVAAAAQAAEASGYDPELDELLQSVRDRAVQLGAARRTAAERGAELVRKRGDVEEQAAEIERLKETADTARRAAEEALHAFEAAEEGLHRAISLNEANHLREGLLPGQPCPVCEQIVDSPPPVQSAPEVEAARAALQSAREARKETDAQARRSEAAFTGGQARLQATRQSLAELESRAAELQAGVAAGEEEIRRALGDRVPEDVGRRDLDRSTDRVAGQEPQSERGSQGASGDGGTGPGEGQGRRSRRARTPRRAGGLAAAAGRGADREPRTARRLAGRDPRRHRVPRPEGRGRRPGRPDPATRSRPPGGHRGGSRCPEPAADRPGGATPPGRSR